MGWGKNENKLAREFSCREFFVRAEMSFIFFPATPKLQMGDRKIENESNGTFSTTMPVDNGKGHLSEIPTLPLNLAKDNLTPPIEAEEPPPPMTLFPPADATAALRYLYNRPAETEMGDRDDGRGWVKYEITKSTTPSCWMCDSSHQSQSRPFEFLCAERAPTPDDHSDIVDAVQFLDMATEDTSTSSAFDENCFIKALVYRPSVCWMCKSSQPMDDAHVDFHKKIDRGDETGRWMTELLHNGPDQGISFGASHTVVTDAQYTVMADDMGDLERTYGQEDEFRELKRNLDNLGGRRIFLDIGLKEGFEPRPPTQASGGEDSELVKQYRRSMEVFGLVFGAKPNDKPYASLGVADRSPQSGDEPDEESDEDSVDTDPDMPGLEEPQETEDMETIWARFQGVNHKAARAVYGPDYMKYFRDDVDIPVEFPLKEDEEEGEESDEEDDEMDTDEDMPELERGMNERFSDVLARELEREMFIDDIKQAWYKYNNDNGQRTTERCGNPVLFAQRDGTRLGEFERAFGPVPETFRPSAEEYVLLSRRPEELTKEQNEAQRQLLIRAYQ